MEIYKQSTGFTCAPSALLMIINHFKQKFKLTRKNEFDIWLKTAVLPTRGSSIYALASYAYRRGINAEIIVGELGYKFPDYRFKGYKKDEVELAEYVSEIYYKKAKKLGINILEKDYTVTKIKNLIKKGKILLLRVDAGVIRGSSPISNYVVVCGYKNKKFIINDPMQGQIKVSEDDMKESLNSLEEKRRRDKRMIVFG